MKAMSVLNPTCCEAVFRFWTADPEQIRQIVQAFVDEAGDPKITVPELKSPEDVDGIRFDACNHNGECIFEPKLGAFVLRMGNNDLQGRAANFVKSLGVIVEEAETSPELDNKYARDCCCGIIHFKDYEKRKVGISLNPLVDLDPKKE